MSREDRERQATEAVLAQSAARVLLLVFAIVCIGTALIPAVLARVYGWEWLLIYPGFMLFVGALGVWRKK